jgi:hypothetical protein
MSRLEKRAIATEADSHIHLEATEIIDDTGRLEGKALLLAEKMVEIAVYIHLITITRKDGKQLLGMYRLIGLVGISK